MRKLAYCALIGYFCCISLSSSAQAFGVLSTAPISPSGNFSANFVEVPLDKARKKIVDHLQKKVNKLDNIETNSTVELTNTQYSDILNQFQGLYVRELMDINKSPISEIEKMQSRSNLEKTFSIALSGRCMTDKKDGVYVVTQDTDGQEIATIWVESERQNPRYGLIDNYQQGFARIKKDGVFGFWDLCGNEVIAPQYEYAERFNDGKALVKKFSWHYVNVNGDESAELKDIEEAKAVKYGVSIAKLKNGNSVLIDNNYDTTQKPISEEFSEILPLTADYLLVKEGKKYGILRIDGLTFANVIYDKITLDKDGKFIFEKGKKSVKRD